MYKINRRMIRALLALILAIVIVTAPVTASAVGAEGQIEEIRELDVSYFWTFELISSNPGCEPCYIPFTGEVLAENDTAYLDDQIWTNTEDGSRSSAKDPQPLKPGYAYTLTAVVKAREGYRFSEELAFTYREEESDATLSLSEDGTTLTIEGLETVTFLLDTPEQVSAVLDYDGVKVSWEESRGAKMYRVLRKESGKNWTALADVAEPAYTDTTAVSGKKYSYTVCCVSADGERAESDFDEDGKSISYVAAPRATLTNAASGVTLKWEKSAGAAKYRIYYMTENGWKKLADTTATSYTDTTVKSDSTRRYTLRAFDSAGKACSAYCTEGWEIRYVAAPKVTKLENINGGTKITISAVDGAVKYRVFVKSGTSGWTKLADTSSLSITNKSVKSGVTYSYTVRCLDENSKYLSYFYSAGWQYTYIAPPAAPTLKNTKNGVQITYKKSAGGTYYRIFRKTGSGKWTKLTDTSSTTYVDKTAKNGTKYSYTVRCINKAGTKFLSGYNTAGKTITCKR